MIPLFKVFMAEDVGDFVLPVLHSGYIGEGEKVKEFEQKFSQMIGNARVWMVNSGTSAITMALRLVGVGYRDEVITTPMTCLATNVPILSLGAIPVWADILQDGTMNPKDVERKITKRTKAILCMDWGGLPCKLDELRSFGIPLVEDACQCTKSIYKGHPLGNDADFVCFSFQAIKTLTTGDGGAIAINLNSTLFEEARLMRWFGLDRTNSKSMRCEQDPPLWGYKFQPNDIAASIGLANIRYFEENVEKAKRNARIYNEEFRELKKVKIIPFDEDRISGSWLYTIFVKDVKNFISYMGDKEIECNPVHDRNDTKTIFKDWRIDLPGVDYFDKHHVCIPVGWWLREEDVSKIVREVCHYGY